MARLFGEGFLKKKKKVVNSEKPKEKEKALTDLVQQETSGRPEHG